MKINEIIGHLIGLRTLNESDQFIVEMANFLADVTELPANIVLWTKPQPEELPHNKYRMKIFKNRIHCATYSISKSPQLLWQSNKSKLRLDSQEADETTRVISSFSTLFVQYIDNTMTADEVKYEIKKLHGENR